jgi:hypothetical protein
MKALYVRTREKSRITAAEVADRVVLLGSADPPLNAGAVRTTGLLLSIEISSGMDALRAGAKRAIRSGAA